MAYTMQGSSLYGKGNQTKSSPHRKDDKKEKRTMSLSDEQTLKDSKNLENAANREKQGGFGDKTVKQQEVTEKSRKRLAVVDAQGKSRKELKKSAKGSKVKKFLTSTKKLKSQVTAKAFKDAKGKKGQALKEGSVKDKDKYSGVKS